MSYTKGEWKASKITTIQGIKMAGGYKYGLWVDNKTSHSLTSESIAFIKTEQDAHLIAAAPDMYEALKELIDRDNYGSIRLPTQASDLMKKVLAKAEGK